MNDKKNFLIPFIYVYIVILAYVAMAAFIHYLIANLIPMLEALIFNYIVEPLPYLGVGVLCGFSLKRVNSTNKISIIVFILLGIIVPVLPYNIPVIRDNNMIILELFLYAHVVFLVIGGFYLFQYIKPSKML